MPPTTGSGSYVSPASRYEGPTTVGCDPSLGLGEALPEGSLPVSLTHPVAGAAAARS